MARILIVLLSFLLALGLFADRFFPYLKEVVLGGTILFAVLDRNANRELLPKIKTAFPLLLIFLIYLFHEAFNGYHIQGQPAINLKFLISIILFIVLSALFSRNPKLVQISYIYFGLGAGFLSMAYAFGLLGSESLEIRNERLILLGENPNSLSVRISLGILFLLWGAIENVLKVKGIVRFLFVIPIPFMFRVIIDSGSKGSFILLLLSVLIYLLMLKSISKQAKRTLIFIGFCLLGGLLLYIPQTALYERFFSASSLTSGRGEIWKAAFHIFYKNPFGVGETGYLFEIDRMLGRQIDTHNIFVYLLVTSGFLGLLFFLFFLFKLLMLNFNQYKIKKDVIPLIVLFSMVFVMSKTGGVLIYLIMWYFLASINSFKYNK